MSRQGDVRVLELAALGQGEAGRIACGNPGGAKAERVGVGE
jgi:hypothetical protein